MMRSDFERMLDELIRFNSHSRKELKGGTYHDALQKLLGGKFYVQLRIMKEDTNT